MLLSLLLFFLQSLGVEVGLASTYGYGEALSGEVTASGRPVGVGIAHRTLPLGTKVLVCRLDKLRCYRTYVLDRGPFGCVREDGSPGWRVAPLVTPRLRLPPTGWRFRGVADLSPEVAGALGYRQGLKPVAIIPTFFPTVWWRELRDYWAEVLYLLRELGLV